MPLWAKISLIILIIIIILLWWWHHRKQQLDPKPSLDQNETERLSIQDQDQIQQPLHTNQPPKSQKKSSS